MANFRTALLATLSAEGLYSNHPSDRGGRTKYGVTESTFKVAVDRGIISGVADIKDLSADQAAAVFKAFFWDEIRGDEMIDDDIAAEIFDTAVNSGPAKATVVAQLALQYLGERVKVDGVMGPITIGLINKWSRKDARALFICLNGFQFVHFVAIVNEGLLDEIEKRVKSDPTQQDFACGWTKRIQEYRKVNASSGGDA